MMTMSDRIQFRYSNIIIIIMLKCFTLPFYIVEHVPFWYFALPGAHIHIFVYSKRHDENYLDWCHLEDKSIFSLGRPHLGNGASSYPSCICSSELGGVRTNINCSAVTASRKMEIPR